MDRTCKANSIKRCRTCGSGWISSKSLEFGLDISGAGKFSGTGLKKIAEGLSNLKNVGIAQILATGNSITSDDVKAVQDIGKSIGLHIKAWELRAIDNWIVIQGQHKI